MHKIQVGFKLFYRYVKFGNKLSLSNNNVSQGLFQLGLLGPLEEGLCALSEDHILYLATNPQSSHAVQAFLSAVTIPAAAKHK